MLQVMLDIYFSRLEIKIKYGFTDWSHKSMLSIAIWTLIHIAFILILHELTIKKINNHLYIVYKMYKDMSYLNIPNQGASVITRVVKVCTHFKRILGLLKVLINIAYTFNFIKEFHILLLI